MASALCEFAHWEHWHSEAFLAFEEKGGGVPSSSFVWPLSIRAGHLVSGKISANSGEAVPLGASGPSLLRVD